MSAMVQSWLWEGYWHLACHRSEVAKPRDFVRFDVDGKELVVFHDGADVIAFDNLCPHRGARLFTESAGNAAFLCAYHGWSYAKGRLFYGRKDQFAHCAGQEPQLNKHHTAWVGDFLFVAIAPRHTVEQQLGGMRSVVERISRAIDYRYDLNSYTYDCIWQVAIENALEPYHVSAVHPETLGSLALERGTDSFYGVNSIWETPIGDKRIDRNVEKLSSKIQFPERFPGYQNIYLFPYSMISSTYGISFSIQNFFPSHRENEANFYSRLFPAKLNPAANKTVFDHFFSSTAEMNRRIFKEDAEICRRVPATSWHSDDPAFYAESEARLVHFRQCYRAAAAAWRTC
ncbi:MAG: Rieske 2Fe-2S domain-containing protein [Sphingopyxis sp.]|nr:Rieske 2Fe-2S domain-containing protein [Sphingopyxis sp.]